MWGIKWYSHCIKKEDQEVGTDGSYQSLLIFSGLDQCVFYIRFWVDDKHFGKRFGKIWAPYIAELINRDKVSLEVHEL